MTDNVVITGIGLITSAGDQASEFPQGVDQSYSNQQKITLFEHQDLQCIHGFEVKDFNALDYLGKSNIRPLDRLARLSVCATHLALADCGFSELDREQQDTALLLGTLFGGLQTIIQFDRDALIDGPNYVMPMDFANTVINAAAGQTAIWHKLRGRNTTITAGCASGLLALGQALDLIRSQCVSSVLAGGAEALHYSSQLAFDQAGLLIREPDQQGFLLGEGAAFFMLESEPDALARNAKILGQIHGYASGFASTPESYVETLTNTMQTALSHAEIKANAIEQISLASNGDVSLDTAEQQAISRCFDPVPALTATKFFVGETLGASGAIQAAGLLETLGQGYGLINAMGYDGNCCSLIISKYHGG